MFKLMKFGLVAVLALSGMAYAQALRQIDVVKVMSFSCSYCLTSEATDNGIENAARSTGGRFVRAPLLDGGEGDIGVRERVYYAAREMGSSFEDRVKRSLYKSAQDAEVSLKTWVQAYAWLTQDMPSDEAKLTELFKRAQDLPAGQALGRAINLANNAGVQSFPTYILISNGSILAVLDNNVSAGVTLSSLRSSVLSNIETLSKKNGTTTTP